MPRGSREDSQDEGSGSHLGHAQAEQASLQSAYCGRFAALATDDTESIGNNSDDCAVEATTGCREFLLRRRRRLPITWQDREPTTCAPTQVEPDSHQERLARVTTTAEDGTRFARGSGSDTGIPSFCRKSGCRGSARRGPTCHQTSTLVSRIRASDVGSCLWRPGMSIVAVVGPCSFRWTPIIVGGVEMAGEDVVYTGWDALRETMLSWGIATREDLSEWIHNQGFVQPRWGAHFCGSSGEDPPRSSDP